MKPQRKIPEAKPLFLERIQQLLTDKKDYENYLNILKIPPVKSIRCNTLKISPDKLKEKLENKGWKIKQPWKDYPEVMVIKFELLPGELGRSLEHLLGYYYIQELASMLPVLALKPKKEELILDLCSAPGSKTTQLASEMQNTGTIIANEVSLGRLKILASNLERCGVANTIITRKDGSAFCKRIEKYNSKIQFDRIIIDAPCSGEGTLRSSYKTYLMWNIKTIKNLPKIQLNLFSSAFEILKPNGTIIYSTCTHAPEENEGVINEILKNYPGELKLEKINLPIKYREGLTEWENKQYSNELKKCARIYPQDNNTEGFFIAKFRKVK
ncbi:MAG: RsmB/NOP family class I SAM-dependent RNA methyltransferase [archaeon]